MSSLLCLLLSNCFGAAGGTVYRSTFFETMEILRIYGYSDEVFKYDGKCILSKAECCDTCVLCSPCPQWSQAVIVVSCDFRSMMVLHFGFRRLSMVGNSRPNLSILQKLVKALMWPGMMLLYQMMPFSAVTWTCGWKEPFYQKGRNLHEQFHCEFLELCIEFFMLYRQCFSYSR